MKLFNFKIDFNFCSPRSSFVREGDIVGCNRSYTLGYLQALEFLYINKNSICFKSMREFIDVLNGSLEKKVNTVELLNIEIEVLRDFLRSKEISCSEVDHILYNKKISVDLCK